MLIIIKNFLSIFYQKVEVYIKDYAVCMIFNTVWYKSNIDFQSLSIPNNCCKYFFIYFMTSLSLLINWKNINHLLILVIVNYLIIILPHK